MFLFIFNKLFALFMNKSDNIWIESCLCSRKSTYKCLFNKNDIDSIN
jgi:hypothetical protein